MDNSSEVGNWNRKNIRSRVLYIEKKYPHTNVIGAKREDKKGEKKKN
jgi:hypothetical protein